MRHRVFLCCVSVVAVLALTTGAVTGQSATASPTPFGDDDFGSGFQVALYALLVGGLLVLVVGGVLVLEAVTPDAGAGDEGNG